MNFSEMHRLRWYRKLFLSYGASNNVEIMRWQKQVFIHTRMSRAYLALARLSCLISRKSHARDRWTDRQTDGVQHLTRSSTKGRRLRCARVSWVCDWSERVRRILVGYIMMLSLQHFLCEARGSCSRANYRGYVKFRSLLTTAGKGTEGAGGYGHTKYEFQCLVVSQTLNCPSV